MMATIGKRFSFEAAHKIPWHTSPDGSPGKCSRLHGHSYRGMAYLRGEIDEKGWVKDFYEMGVDLKSLEGAFDHQYLNERAPFDRAVELSEGRNWTSLDSGETFWPTTEHVAAYFLWYLRSQDSRYCKVVIQETDTSEVVVTAEDL